MVFGGKKVVFGEKVRNELLFFSVFGPLKVTNLKIRVAISLCFYYAVYFPVLSSLARLFCAVNNVKLFE